MADIKRKQPWPDGVTKGPTNLMQTKDGDILMLGHVIDDQFYTADVGRDKWEVWDVSDLTAIERLVE